MKKILQWIAGRFGLVVIDWRTAEYLAIMSGQVPWGNQKRRGYANHELGKAMAFAHLPMSGSIECFQEATWDITIKKR